ncbi:peptidase S1 and S6 chymotrypsin/Hap [Actinoplanes friuliensis DSM 7358]|uniref:Peptidase S1 and S6 chymotrypsin/Hap n=2 Tax=Actinoplanes friuliensis TaxID=196914 RepID=U5VZ73_9ACTN|nr:peptidase S1 and S6 chymotrypsin/Hap [Actinoplanes friuliensis DSM 7358]
MLALTAAVASTFFVASSPATAAFSSGPVRITGGTLEDDSAAESGWMATIVTPAKPCSATLIAPSWVLTAGECFSGDVPGAAPGSVAGPDDVVRAAGQTRKVTWASHRGYLTLARLDRPIQSAYYPPLAQTDPVAGARTYMYGAGTGCVMCRQVGRYRSAPLTVIQNDYWNLYYGSTLLSASPVGTFTLGDFGGAQMQDGVLAGVLVGSGETQYNTAPTNVISYKVAPARSWILQTKAANPPPGTIVTVPTCPVFVCGK